MANREPDLQFESEYHPRLIVGDGIDRDTIDRTPMERAGWDAFNGDSTPERRSQQGDSDERSSWYERNDRRHRPTFSTRPQSATGRILDVPATENAMRFPDTIARPETAAHITTPI